MDVQSKRLSAPDAPIFGVGVVDENFLVWDIGNSCFDLCFGHVGFENAGIIAKATGAPCCIKNRKHDDFVWFLVEVACSSCYCLGWSLNFEKLQRVEFPDINTKRGVLIHSKELG